MSQVMPPEKIKKPLGSSAVFRGNKMRILTKNGISTASLKYMTVIKVDFVTKTWNGVIV